VREAVRCIGWRIGSDPIPSRARFRADNRTLPGTALVAGNKYRYRSARRPDEHIGLDSIHVSEVIGSVDATLGRLKSLPDAIGLNAATSILDGDAALSHDVVYIPRMVMPRTRGLADRCFERPGAVHQARLTNVRVMVGQALIFPAHLQIRDSALNTSTIAQGSRCLFPRIRYLLADRHGRIGISVAETRRRLMPEREGVRFGPCISGSRARTTTRGFAHPASRTAWEPKCSWRMEYKSQPCSELRLRK